jgi:hypothetical protein
MATSPKTEVAKLKDKLRKAEAELRVLKAQKPVTPKETKALEGKLEKIFNEGYKEAIKDMQKAEDIFKKHMDKAASEFKQKIFPKLKKAVASKGKKSKSKAKKAK